MTLSRSEVLGLLDANGLRPSRALGQNFMADPNTVRKIVRLAGVGAGDRVIEIGAGLGCLTLGLLEAGARVTAVELDRHVLPVLRGLVEPRGAQVVEGDAMTLDWPTLLPAADGPWALVANLPYNVATPLVLDLLDAVPQITSFLVLVQREVAERLAAGPRDDAYGAPSVKVRYWATASLAAKVPATVFVPKPKVESALVRIERRPGGPLVPATVVDPERLFTVVRAAFGQRRKMVRGSLAGLVDPAVFERSGVPATARPEELDVEQFAALATLP